MRPGAHQKAPRTKSARLVDSPPKRLATMHNCSKSQHIGGFSIWVNLRNSWCLDFRTPRGPAMPYPDPLWHAKPMPIESMWFRTTRSSTTSLAELATNRAMFSTVFLRGTTISDGGKIRASERERAASGVAGVFGWLRWNSHWCQPIWGMNPLIHTRNQRPGRPDRPLRPNGPSVFLF